MFVSLSLTLSLFLSFPNSGTNHIEVIYIWKATVMENMCTPTLWIRNSMMYTHRHQKGHTNRKATPKKKYIFSQASLYALLSHTPLRYDGGAAEHTVIPEVTLFHRDDDAAQQLHNHTHTYSTTWTKTVKISVCALASQIVRILVYIYRLLCGGCLFLYGSIARNVINLYIWERSICTKGETFVLLWCLWNAEVDCVDKWVNAFIVLVMPNSQNLCGFRCSFDATMYIHDIK